jgi:hypothetical protein
MKTFGGMRRISPHGQRAQEIRAQVAADTAEMIRGSAASRSIASRIYADGKSGLVSEQTRSLIRQQWVLERAKPAKR